MKNEGNTESIELCKKYTSAKTLIQNYISFHYLKRIAKGYREERGQRMACFANEEIGIELAVNGIYERFHLEALLKLISKLGVDSSSMSFCDIGANIGNHSVYLSKYFSKVYAFEPNPDVFYFLKYNLGKVGNARVFMFGLGDCEADLTLAQNDENLGASRLEKNSTPSDITSLVEIKRFDDVYENETPIGLIKIDVEGMEYSVLNGAVKMLKKHRPIIAFEQHKEDLLNKEFSSVSLLEDLGYVVCWFDLSSQTQSRFLRFKDRLLEVIRGRTSTIKLVIGERIPEASHTMLIAIPSELKENLV